jgi:hypothetical protein
VQTIAAHDWLPDSLPTVFQNPSGLDLGDVCGLRNFELSPTSTSPLVEAPGNFRLMSTEPESRADIVHVGGPANQTAE